MVFKSAKVNALIPSDPISLRHIEKKIVSVLKKHKQLSGEITAKNEDLINSVLSY